MIEWFCDSVQKSFDQVGGSGPEVVKVSVMLGSNAAGPAGARSD